MYSIDIYIDVDIIHIMYIAEWSVVKDIGEAKLHPFFIFFLFFFRSDSRDCESFSKWFRRHVNVNTQEESK